MLPSPSESDNDDPFMPIDNSSSSSCSVETKSDSEQNTPVKREHFSPVTFGKESNELSNDPSFKESNDTFGKESNDTFGKESKALILTPTTIATFQSVFRASNASPSPSPSPSNQQQSKTNTPVSLFGDLTLSSPLSPQVIQREREVKAEAESKDNLNVLVFEFCKADWNSKRYSLLKKEADEKRNALHSRLLPFLKLPDNMKPNGWRIDLSTLSPEQLNEIGGAGYIELRTNMRSTIGSLETIHEEKEQESTQNTQNTQIQTWLKRTQAKVVHASLTNQLTNQFQSTSEQTDLFFRQCLQASQQTPIHNSSISVKRFARGTNSTRAVQARRERKRAFQEFEGQKEQQPNKKQKGNSSSSSFYQEISGKACLSIEEAEKFMF